LLDSALLPAGKPIAYAVPEIALLRQIAPRCSRARDAGHGIDEHTIVPRRRPAVALLARESMLDPLALIGSRIHARHWPTLLGSWVDYMMLNVNTT
jgi:hypothetical protein